MNIGQGHVPMKADEFRAQLQTLQSRIAEEVSSHPARLQDARTRLKEQLDALMPLLSKLAPQAPRGQVPRESTRDYERRKFAEESAFRQPVLAEVDRLSDTHGASLDRVQAHKVFLRAAELGGVGSGPVLRDALKYHLAEQARAGRAADDAADVAYLNAVLDALGNVPTDDRAARR